MKIIIFGSTGTLGRHLVSQALERGHQVTAFARNPDKLKDEHPALTIVRGDVSDFTSVDRAMPGHDAVIVALGAGAKGTVRTQGTRQVIRAMAKHGIRRLVCISSLGVGDSRANLNFLWKHIMFGMLLRRAYADHVAQERAVNESGLEWVIVRPAAYTDGPVTGAYKHGFPPTDRSLALKISRADVADFSLRQLQDDRYLRQSPGLSY